VDVAVPMAPPAPLAVTIIVVPLAAMLVATPVVLELVTNVPPVADAWALNPVRAPAVVPEDELPAVTPLVVTPAAVVDEELVCVPALVTLEPVTPEPVVPGPPVLPVGVPPDVPSAGASGSEPEQAARNSAPATRQETASRGAFQVRVCL
jgi:hypothetical protein